MYFIDFHCHVYPDAIASKAADNVRQFYNGLGNPAIDGSVETLLDRGTKAGVEKFVILPVAVQPSRTRHINDFILEQLPNQPRFYGFGTIHAAMNSQITMKSFTVEIHNIIHTAQVITANATLTSNGSLNAAFSNCSGNFFGRNTGNHATIAVPSSRETEPMVAA